jgi:hypothetical protein
MIGYLKYMVSGVKLLIYPFMLVYIYFNSVTSWSNFSGKREKAFFHLSRITGLQNLSY